MNVDRLQRLAKLLRDNAANPTGAKFDLGKWVKNPDHAPQKPAAESPVPMDCGTTACAIGLAAISGIFKDDGLGLVRPDAPGLRYSGEFCPSYKGLIGLEAAEGFFGLDHEQAHVLFMPDQYGPESRVGADGELAVAERIDLLIASDGDWRQFI